MSGGWSSFTVRIQWLSQIFLHQQVMLPKSSLPILPPFKSPVTLGGTFYIELSRDS